jgi:hypothetical protein
MRVAAAGTRCWLALLVSTLLTSRYRTHSGKVVTIKTTRNLSVVCS